MTEVRRIGSTEFTTPSDREVTMTRVFDAPRRLVFEAWTRPEHLSRWMLGPDGWSMPLCEMDVRPGGAWRFGWRHTDGSEMRMWGSYVEVVPPERLVTTENWGGDYPETVNTVTLTEQDGRTTLTQTVLYASKEARDAALETGMEHGVSQSFERLDAHLPAMR